MTIYTADGLVGALRSRVVTIVGHRAARPGPARTQLDLARLGPSTVSCRAGPYHGAGTSTASRPVYRTSLARHHIGYSWAILVCKPGYLQTTPSAQILSYIQIW